MNSLSSLDFFLTILGGGFLQDLIQVISSLQQPGDIITTIVSIVTILASLWPVIRSLQEYRRKENTKFNTKLEVEIGGEKIIIEAKDLEDAQKLFERFNELHPKIIEKQAKKSSILVNARVAKSRDRTKVR